MTITEIIQCRVYTVYDILEIYSFPFDFDRCIKSDWNIPAEKSGVDFRQLLSSLSTQVGIMKRNIFNDIEKKVWTSNAL